MTDSDAAARLRNLAPAAFALFGLLVAAFAILAAVQSGAPGSVSVLPLAYGLDQRADALLTSDPGRARALSWRILSLQPTNAGAWLRLARLEASSSQGRLTAQASTWLERSYDAGPYDPGVLVPRLAFAYNHWAELNPDLRAQTLSQVRSAWPDWEQRRQLVAVVDMVQSPVGKIMLAAQLFTMRLNDNVAFAAAHAAKRPAQ